MASEDQGREAQAAVLARLEAQAAPFALQAPEPELPPLSADALRATLRKQRHKSVGCDGWLPGEMLFWPTEALQALAGIFNSIEQGAEWPRPLLEWRQVHLAKPGRPVGLLTDTRPISVGAAAYRAWSATRVRSLGRFLTNQLPAEVHGGLPGRGVATALLEPLVEVEVAQTGAGRSLRYLGSSDLSKAFDSLHGRLATAALRRLRYPASLCQALTRAWAGQRRLFQLGLTAPTAVTEVYALPQGDPHSPAGLTAPLAEALLRIKSRRSG